MDFDWKEASIETHLISELKRNNMNLQFVPRKGRLILQYMNTHKGWLDVPTAEPTEPREFWLSCGRYFESKDDALIFAPAVEPFLVKEVK